MLMDPVNICVSSTRRTGWCNRAQGQEMHNSSQQKDVNQNTFIEHFTKSVKVRNSCIAASVISDCWIKIKKKLKKRKKGTYCKKYSLYSSLGQTAGWLWDRPDQLADLASLHLADPPQLQLPLGGETSISDARSKVQGRDYFCFDLPTTCCVS